MALLHPDRRQRISWSALLTAGALFCATLVHAAAATRGDEIRFKGDNSEGNINAGTLALDNVELRQGTTLIRAKKANATNLVDGEFENSSWKLVGEVHIEFEAAVLDAQTATVVFADGRLKTVDVQGAPSRFSHQLKNAARRVQGRAGRIEFDAGKNVARFSGDAWFSDGRYEFETQALTYNLSDGGFRTETDSRGTIQSPRRVPAPRTPDRASAP